MPQYLMMLGPYPLGLVFLCVVLRTHGQGKAGVMGGEPVPLQQSRGMLRWDA